MDREKSQNSNPVYKCVVLSLIFLRCRTEWEFFLNICSRFLFSIFFFLNQFGNCLNFFVWWENCRNVIEMSHEIITMSFILHVFSWQIKKPAFFQKGNMKDRKFQKYTFVCFLYFLYLIRRVVAGC